MTLRQADRVKETAASPGSGQVTLGGAVGGFIAFSAIASMANGDTVYYCIYDGLAAWEVGLGTYVTSGNKLTRTTVYASSNSGSAVTFANPVTIFGAAPALKVPLLDASGNLAIGGSVSVSQTGGIVGTTTNNDATAGSIGEYISNTLAVGSAVSLVTATPKDVISISLTAGDWNVWGSIGLLGTTGTFLRGWTSATSATTPTLPNNGGMFEGNISPSTGETLAPVGVQRFSLGATTTIYLSASAIFGSGSNTAYGFIGARRVR